MATCITLTDLTDWLLVNDTVKTTKFRQRGRQKSFSSKIFQNLFLNVNFSYASSKQYTYEVAEIKADVKNEKKITSNLKQNCKSFYSYLRNKHTKRNETKRNETKRNETKRNETKRNETKRNETKRNETKRNETKRNETKRNEK